MNKRGQAAAGAAVLVAIILGVLVGFVILVSPAERADLLGEPIPNTTSRAAIEEAAVAKNLLEVNPGKIDFLGLDKIEHPLPVINIYTRTESEVIAERNVASAKRGLFSEEPDQFTFTIDDLEHTQDLFFVFNVEILQGKLIILLNGEQIYNAEPMLGNVLPVHLPQNALKDNNEVAIRVSSPGLAFWRTNGVTLNTIKIVGEVTNVQAQSSKNTFLVSETEKRNIERVKLRLQPDCNLNDVGKLTITINDEEIYSGVPDCDLAFVPLEISPEAILEGENDIEFHTQEGSYVLSHLILTSELSEPEFPTYFFKLDEDQFDDVRDGDRKVRLQVDFVDIARKYGEFIFNGDAIPFDTRESTLVIDLSTDAVEGNNALKVKPQKTLEIRELRVDLVR
ncbi:MAG TPA: hypothetical protein VJI32_07210 [Candidatus Nanoarchaeia archaeon]|nr:hypothetical protein [Candidatus Nanoarchaeia archaeon]